MYNGVLIGKIIYKSILVKYFMRHKSIPLFSSNSIVSCNIFSVFADWILNALFFKMSMQSVSVQVYIYMYLYMFCIFVIGFKV